MITRPEATAVIAAAYRAACELDVVALKPGNVRDDAPFADMDATDFRRSADATAGILADAGEERIGVTVRRAISATRAVVRCNTNLGIVLLAAPLCRAFALCDPSRDGIDAGLAAGLGVELARLGRDDAVDVYAAIREARPGGLGRRAHHDIAEEPQVTLREAMCAAAADDTIARQYCDGFAEIFSIGVPAWSRGVALFGDESGATTWVFMQFLASLPDSHLVRRHGAAAAAAVQARASDLVVRYEGARTEWRTGLERCDADWRRQGWNPGTTADLTVASVLAAKLAATVYSPPTA